MRAVGYTRVSTEEQTKGFSLETQEEEIRALCEKNGWILVKIYSDPGLSGATMNRPGLKELLEGAERREFDLVLVREIDRLSRELSDFWPIVARLRRSGVALSTLALPGLLSTQKEFYLAYGGFSGMPQYYREELLEKTAKGREKARAEGKNLGRPPLGFKKGKGRGELELTPLGRRAKEILGARPEIKLSELAEELSTPEVTIRVKQAWQLKRSIKSGQ